MALSVHLSSLDLDFNYEPTTTTTVVKSTTTVADRSIEAETFVDHDPFKNPKTLQWFHKEVERFEKIMEALNVKTLNGTSQLDSKWTQLQDLLVNV